MADKLVYWGATGVAFLVLVLAVSGIVLHGQNAELQQQAQQRAQQISAGQNFAQLFQGVVQNLATAAVEKDDAAIRGLLEAEGLKLNPPAKAEAGDKTPRAKK